MNKKNDKYEAIPFPRMRRLMVDGGRMGRQKHTIHGLVEMDVTRARRAIRDHKARTGETLSFTAFVMACLGRAVDMNKHMHAYRDWRNQLILFDEVDVSTLFEVEVDGHTVIRPHIIRAVNKKSFPDLHKEIRTFQTEHEGSREAKFIREYLSVTISFDHDIVDGAPATRFAQQLKELIEGGYGISEDQQVHGYDQSLAIHSKTLRGE